MKKYVRSIPAVLLSLSLLLTALPGTALAAEEPTQRGVLTYTHAIAPQYEDAMTFSQGLAAVKQGGKWGYIDTDGKTVIPFAYDLAHSFHEGLAIVGKRTQRSFVSSYGDAYTLDVYEVGFIDRSGKYTPFQMKDLDSGKLIPYYVEFEYFDQATLFFHNGLVALPGEYANSYYGTDGLPFDSNAMSPNGPMNEGLAPATSSVSWDFGYINEKGATVLFWDSIVYFGPEFLDGAGNKVQSYGMISSGYPFNQGLAPVWQYTYDAKAEEGDYLLGFIDKTGSWVIQPQFKNFFYLGVNSIYQVFDENGLAMVDKNGKYGAINKRGETVIPFQYDQLWPSQEGMIPFAQNGKFGYLNSSGKVVIPAQFEKTSGFNNGMAAVANGTKAYFIDKAGKAIPGSEKLASSDYFAQEADGTQTLRHPETYMIISANGKYGFAKLSYLAPLPQVTEMSAWAHKEVSSAIEKNLVPTNLQSLYRNNITRSEFCDLVIQAITQVEGKSVQTLVKERTGKDYYTWIGEYPFNDTTNGNVIAAYALGIVQGRGGPSFDPYATITRQEAAAFLTRAAKVLGMDTANVITAPFADRDTVGVWFKDAVNFVHQINVMSGNGNSFSPLGSYTREQSYLTIYRLFLAVKG